VAISLLDLTVLAVYEKFSALVSADLSRPGDRIAFSVKMAS